MKGKEKPCARGVKKVKVNAGGGYGCACGAAISPSCINFDLSVWVGRVWFASYYIPKVLKIYIP
jgi:hypothetical protein